MKPICLILLLPALLHGADHKLGFKPSPHGVRAPSVEEHPRFNAAPLPATATVRQWFYPTNQADLGSCGPTSYREVYDAAYQKKHDGKFMVVSALDVYQRTSVAQGDFPEDGGVNNSTLLQVVLKGALLEKTWPYDTSKYGTLPRASKTKDLERSRHQTLKGYSIPTTDGGYAIRQCIANLKIAPIIGTNWYANSSTAIRSACKTKDASGNPATVTRWCVPKPRGNPVGGHDIPAISYDMNMVFPDGSVGGVEFHNHWQNDDGSPWGDEIGAAWAPIAWFFNPRYIDDPIAIEIIDR
jgi:hypothetical protein